MPSSYRYIGGKNDRRTPKPLQTGKAFYINYKSIILFSSHQLKYHCYIGHKNYKNYLRKIYERAR